MKTQHAVQEALERTAPRGLDITVRTGTGAGRTLISAFDGALHAAGVADFNLVTLSSVIPTGARIRHVDAPLPGGHGDLLFCVRAEAFADQPGAEAWSGLGWCADETGAGLFVEHHGATEAVVVGLIEASLSDMQATRARRFGPVQMALASAVCVEEPVCSVVVAAYRVSSWEEPGAADQAGRPAAADRAAQHTRTFRTPERPSAPVPATHSNGTAPVPATHSNGTATRSENGTAPRSSHGHTVTAGPTSEPPQYDDEVVAPLPAASPDGGPVHRVSVEREVDYATALRFYELYRRAFGFLATDAAARQVLHQEEFVEEMLDPRVHKYIAWDEAGSAIGMTTLTKDLDTVPWISPAYFLEHYADQVARDAVYYFGFALVDPERQGAQVLRSLIEPMAREVHDHHGVVAWDLCRINEDRGFGATYRKFLSTIGDVQVTAIDQQTYYAAVFDQQS